jgi:hypothetical protein
MRRINPRTAVVAALMTVTTLSNTACFASFPLTRKLYAWNKGVSSEKWVQELAFLALGVLLPVYGVAALIDTVILNSMEFWTGKPAMSSSGPETKVKAYTQGDVKVQQTMTRSAEGRTMVLEESVAGQFRSRTTLHQDAGASMVTATTTFADGRSETRMLTVDEAGRFTVSGSKMIPRTLSATELNAISARLGNLSAVGAN